MFSFMFRFITATAVLNGFHFDAQLIKWVFFFCHARSISTTVKLNRKKETKYNFSLFLHLLFKIRPNNNADYILTTKNGYTSYPFTHTL